MRAMQSPDSICLCERSTFPQANACMQPTYTHSKSARGGALLHNDYLSRVHNHADRRRHRRSTKTNTQTVSHNMGKRILGDRTFSANA
jgi:hypothetical protein